MKRTLVFVSSILFFMSCLNASLTGRISVSEELAYQKYNKIWESPRNQYYSVESIASNPNISCNLDFVFGDVFGITSGTEFGYQKSIEDKNRFVTFPKNINGTVSSGLVIYFKSLRISAEALLRSSFQFTRNAWVSQVGGQAGVGYTFPCGICLDITYKYLSSYEMITSALSVGIGYQFGGKK